MSDFVDGRLEATVGSAMTDPPTAGRGKSGSSANGASPSGAEGAAGSSAAALGAGTAADTSARRPKPLTHRKPKMNGTSAARMTNATQVTRTLLRGGLR